jgi:hypothetical protein
MISPSACTDTRTPGMNEMETRPSTTLRIVRFETPAGNGDLALARAAAVCAASTRSREGKCFTFSSHRRR